MNIQMIGIDHQLASVDYREIFSFTKNASIRAMEEIHKEEGVLGCVILSTCNRMELWVSGEDSKKLPLFEILCRVKGLDPLYSRDKFVARENEEAIRHLFYTTSGLNSMILCEDQILSQVKAALQNAREAFSTDPVLETLFRMAITGTKKVKSGMQMSTANLSAVEQAVSRMRENGFVFADRKCIVIGNGEMGKRAALALKAEGADVTVTVRQYRSGVVEIPVGCKRINYGDRYELIPQCDILVSATNSPNPTITYEKMRELTLPEHQILIDLAVPRDIEPEVKNIEGITLYDIDSFHVTQSEELAIQIRQAKQILEEHIEEFLNWYECRDLVPMVRQIGQIASEDVYWRMGKTVKSLALPEEEGNSLHKAVCNSSEKVIEKLLFTIRDEAGTDVFRKCLKALVTEG